MHRTCSPYCRRTSQLASEGRPSRFGQINRRPRQCVVPWNMEMLFESKPEQLSVPLFPTMGCWMFCSYIPPTGYGESGTGLFLQRAAGHGWADYVGPDDEMHVGFNRCHVRVASAVAALWGGGGALNKCHKPKMCRRLESR